MFGMISFNNRPIRSELSSTLFDEFFNDSFSLTPLIDNRIRLDVKETQKEYIVEAEIPGVKKEDIKVEYSNNTISILVDNRSEVKEEKENYIRRERRFGCFRRQFYIENIKEDQITAKYDNGILTIILPKKEKDKPNKKSIEIQ